MSHFQAYPLDATAVLADEFEDRHDQDDDEPDYLHFQAEHERQLHVQRRRPVRRMRAHW